MRSRDRLGMLTDRFVQTRATAFVDRGSYQIARTPSRPNFFSGNYLILDQPPAADDDEALADPDREVPRTVSAWLQRCREELADIPIQALRLAWETEPLARPDSGSDWPYAVHAAHADWFPEDASYTCTPVLAIEPPIVASALPPGYTVRPLLTDSDWDDLGILALAVSAGDAPEYIPFVHWQLDELRRTTAEVGGHFWGAFYQDELAAALGLLCTPVGLRFQEVQTHPSHRRRGLCAALCTHALSQQIQPGAPQTGRAIIVTELGSEAERVYRRIGFTDVGLQHTLIQPVITP